ncbi:hypothetical protein Q5752_005555 [Cryptotrichosporon argae]
MPLLPRGVARYNLLLALALGLFVSLLLLSRYESHTSAALQQVVAVAAAKARVVNRPGGLLGRPSGEADAERREREWELRRALQFAGTGARVDRFLDKARRGKPFVVSAVGGSVSKGRGLVPPDGVYSSEGAEALATLYSPENLHVIVFDWLNKTFPHAENRFINGAQGGVGSGYFGWCFKEHIPEDSDLILVELGINDLQQLNVIPKYEHLVRSLLELESQPAIINIETFTTLFPNLISSSSLHQDVVAYYDVPSLSIRDLLLPRILADPDKQLPRWFRTGGDVALGDSKVREWGGVPVDLMHISALGHSLAAGLIISYLNEQLASITSTKIGRASVGIRSAVDVPPTFLTQSFNLDELPERRAPICRSMNSPRLHRPISGTDDAPLVDGMHEPELVRGLVLADESDGWTRWAWGEKNYLVSSRPGALAVFHFVTPEPEASEVRPVAAKYADPHHLAYRPTGRVRRDDRRVMQSRIMRRQDTNLAPAGAEGVEDSVGEDVAGAIEVATPVAEAAVTRPAKLGPPVNVEADTTADQAGVAPVEVDGKGGSVSIGYQRSANYGLGSVWCWVDEARDAGRRIDGYWPMKERNMGIVDEIVDGLAPGPHRLQCELLEDTLDPLGRREFRLFAVMHD